ncbi:hypothetical protein ACFW9M_04570 [Streptomyces lydicus]|uniref:hypothetical protein n=1 Tax=Streptomyces lydicus TaxID=47763 RepID=UPI0036BB28C2
MQKQESEQLAFWVCRRMLGRIAPYDRCFLCGDMHLPPSDEHPHNGRYDFAGVDAAVEVVSIVHAEARRNLSSWQKKHPGEMEGEPHEFGLTLPWNIDIRGATATSELEHVLEAVRSTEQTGNRIVHGYQRDGDFHLVDHRSGVCGSCFDRSTSFDAHVDDEGLMTSRPGLAIVLVGESLRIDTNANTTSLFAEKMQRLLYPAQGRSDVQKKMDRAEQHGKKRRAVCFVLDVHYSFSLRDTLFKKDGHGYFPWSGMRPVTDIVIASAWRNRAIRFSIDQPTTTMYVRDSEKTPSPRTLGCPTTTT